MVVDNNHYCWIAMIDHDRLWLTGLVSKWYPGTPQLWEYLDCKVALLHHRGRSGYLSTPPNLLDCRYGSPNKSQLLWELSGSRRIVHQPLGWLHQSRCLSAEYSSYGDIMRMFNHMRSIYMTKDKQALLIYDHCCCGDNHSTRSIIYWLFSCDTRDTKHVVATQ